MQERGGRTICTQVSGLEKKRAFVVLEENPFRPSGGGQPSDTGTLSGEGFAAKVVDVREAEGCVTLELKLDKGIPTEGMEVETVVDLERRFLHSRMHSGEHILSKALESVNPGLHVYKVAIGDEETSVYLRWDAQLSWEVLFSAEDEANAVIARDLPVEIRSLARAEASALPGLKANWDRIEDDHIRVVSIPGVDCIACSGSHVGHTGEVGRVLVQGFNGSAPEWSFTFTVHGDRVGQTQSRVARQLARQIGCKPEELERVYQRLQDEGASLRRALDKARPLIELPWERESYGAGELFVAHVTALPNDLATPAVKRVITENPKAVALVLLPSGVDESCSFLLARGEEAILDCRAVVKNEQLLAKGGGAPGWVSGSCRCSSTKVWREALFAAGGGAS